MGCGSSKSLVPPPVTAQTKPQTKKSRAKALHTAVTNSKEIVKAGRKQMALENSAKGHLQLWAKNEDDVIKDAVKVWSEYHHELEEMQKKYWDGYQAFVTALDGVATSHKTVDAAVKRREDLQKQLNKSKAKLERVRLHARQAGNEESSVDVFQTDATVTQQTAALKLADEQVREAQQEYTAYKVRTMRSGLISLVGAHEALLRGSLAETGARAVQAMHALPSEPKMPMAAPSSWVDEDAFVDESKSQAAVSEHGRTAGAGASTVPTSYAASSVTPSQPRTNTSKSSVSNKSPVPPFESAQNLHGMADYESTASGADTAAVSSGVHVRVTSATTKNSDTDRIGEDALSSPSSTNDGDGDNRDGLGHHERDMEDDEGVELESETVVVEKTVRNTEELYDVENDY